MKIIVDDVKCTGLGICESLAPDHFEIDDSGNLELLAEFVENADMATVEAAIEGCPTAALRLSS